MKVLVTGASGFVGSNLARRLLSLGHEVLVTFRSDEQPAIAGVVGLGTSFYNLALESTARQLQGVEAVLHQAADNDPQSKDLVGIHKVNVFGTSCLFESLYKAGCRKFIYASSTAVYGASPSPYVEGTTPLDPLTPYAYSKIAVEQYAHAFHRLRPDARMIGLRYCNVYGPGEQHKGQRASVIHQMIRDMKNGNPPRLFKWGQQMRDWVHVEDVVDANLLALEATDFRDEVVNIGSGGCVSFELLSDWINMCLGTMYSPFYVENPFEATYQNKTLCDITAARQILGYEPKFTGIQGIKHYTRNWS